MLFFKNYFVGTTQEVDFLPILHDIRFAIRDSGAPEGLVTVTLPQNGASLWIHPEAGHEDLLKKVEELKSHQQRSITLPFQRGELLLAPKEMIYLIDKMDSGKRREFHVTVQGAGVDKQEGTPAGGRGRPQGRGPQGGKN